MNRSTFSKALQQPVSKASSANTSAGLRNLHQLIQLGDGLLALLPKRIRLIQDRRNPPLGFQWRKGDFNIGNNGF